MSRIITASIMLMVMSTAIAQPAFISTLQDLRGPFTERFSDATISDLAIADVDGDGDNDLIMAESASLDDRASFVFLNDGLGYFVPSTQSIGIGVAGALAVGDLNGDGFPDLVLANLGNAFDNDEVYLNNGAGFFNLSQTLERSRSRDVVIADFTGDGAPDLFFALARGNTLGFPNRLYVSNGSGSFAVPEELTGNTASFSGAAGDLDGDGDLDLFLGNGGPNEVLINVGGMLTPDAAGYGDALTTDVLLGDVDNDGDLDAFSVNSGLNFDTGEGQPNRLWLNAGNGTFTDSGAVFENVRTEAGALVDMDNDGWLDVWFGNLDGQDSVWLNQSGTFSPANLDLLPQGFTTGVAAGDLDGDGDPDIAVTDFEGNRVWLNVGGNSTPGVSIAPARALINEHGRPQLFALEGFPLGIPLRFNGTATANETVTYSLSAEEQITESELVVDRPGPAVTINTAPLPALGSGDNLALSLTGTSSLPLGAPTEADYFVIRPSTINPDANQQKVGFDFSDADDCLADFICLFADSSLLFCQTGANKASIGAGLNLGQLRRLRDEIMLPSAAGRYFSGLYYDFGSELITVVFSHPTLIYDVTEANRLWSPAIDSVLDGDGSYPISPEMGSIYREVTDQLKAFGSPELRQQIEQEDALIQPISFVGRTAGEYWDAVTSALPEGVFRSGFEATPL